jgi:hypothetical protein
MNKVMVFIDFENFNISKYNYYKTIHPSNFDITKTPTVDFVCLAERLTETFTANHQMVKAFLFAPKPDDFLMRYIEHSFVIC